jgi:hypothetical protein
MGKVLRRRSELINAIDAFLKQARIMSFLSFTQAMCFLVVGVSCSVVHVAGMAANSRDKVRKSIDELDRVHTARTHVYISQKASAKSDAEHQHIDERRKQDEEWYEREIAIAKRQLAL